MEILNVQVKVNPVEAALVACPSSCALYVQARGVQWDMGGPLIRLLIPPAYFPRPAQ